MNYTEHYQLNQWDAADRVLRQDFNVDNQKIDAAVKAVRDAVDAEATARAAAITELKNKSRFMKLKEINVTANTTTIEINLGDVDWAKWDKVHLDMITTNGSQMLIYFNAVVNDTHKFTLGGSNQAYQPRLTFYPGFRSDRRIFATFAASIAGSTDTYAALQKLIITGNTMYAGASFTLWGEA